MAHMIPVSDDRIYFSRWGFAILLGLFLNALAVVYGAGILTNRVAELERRMGVVEQLLIGGR